MLRMRDEQRDPAGHDQGDGADLAPVVPGVPLTASGRGRAWASYQLSSGGGEPPGVAAAVSTIWPLRIRITRSRHAGDGRVVGDHRASWCRARD